MKRASASFQPAFHHLLRAIGLLGTTDAGGSVVRCPGADKPPTTLTDMTPALFETTDVSTVKSASTMLFADGAIASLAGEPRPILIGDLQWPDDRELLMFTAYGAEPADAHRVRFDDALLHASGSITFLSCGEVVATIQRIEDADIDDPDDYRIAHRLWSDVAPVYRARIDRCYEALA
jgi:hypothetical protein